MKIILKEGEQMKIIADNKNEYAYLVVENYKGVILKKKEVEILENEEKVRSTRDKYNTLNK